MWSHGGEWTGFDEWIEFLRHVCFYERDGRVDYSNWDHWHQATMHGGVRIMHEKFCIISDRPEFIKMDNRNRPHCDDGPFKRYRDGWALYYIHGVRVDREIVENPASITLDRIKSEANAEVRRVLIDRYGSERYIRDLGAVPIDSSRYGKLYRIKQRDDEDIVMIEMINSTPEPISHQPEPGEHGVWHGGRWFKCYMDRVSPSCKTAHEAQAWRNYHTVDTYRPLIET